MNKLPTGDSELGEAEIEGLVTRRPPPGAAFSRLTGGSRSKSPTKKCNKRFIIPGFLCFTLVAFMVSHLSGDRVTSTEVAPTDVAKINDYDDAFDDYLDDKDIVSSQDDTYGESIYARHENPGSENSKGIHDKAKSEKGKYDDDDDDGESLDDGQETKSGKDHKWKSTKSPNSEDKASKVDTDDESDHTVEEIVENEETGSSTEEDSGNKEGPSEDDTPETNEKEDQAENDDIEGEDNKEQNMSVETTSNDSKDSLDDLDSKEQENSVENDDGSEILDDDELHEGSDDIVEGHDETGDEHKTFEDENESYDEEAEIEALIEKWGKWHFWDGDPDSRPKEDFLAAYENRDCPYDDFPETSWQADAVYVNHLLDSAVELVVRAKEAIYTEYGWGPREDLDTKQIIERSKMFRLSRLDLSDDEVEEPSEAMDRGGWTTSRTFDSLSRRLLHAMMTNDDFTVVLGGHSAAAGHGNHFHQSYMMQFHKILDPIFKRMGVNLVTRNLAQAGSGTLQSSLGSKSIYGDKIDMIVWDSREGSDAIDLFARQALLGGKTPPIIWGGDFSVLKDLYNAGADVMQHGSGMYGIPITYNDEQAETLPWATRYMKCSDEDSDLCEKQQNRFRTKCWIERDDVTPPTKQRDHCSGQEEWQPGFRIHQLKGRVMVVAILDALQDALATWSDITIFAGHPLQDEYWHVTDMYEEMQSKVRDIKPGVGACGSFNGAIPERVCRTPLQGRTEFTPRSNPNATSITGILKAVDTSSIPSLNETMLYYGPDVENPALMTPHGEFDVLTIVSNRRRLGEITNLYDFWHVPKSFDPSNEQLKTKPKYLRRRAESDEIVLGKGWDVQGYPGNCDGTATGICGRLSSSDCLLYGHMDAKGGISGNESSGWLVMNLDNLSEGIIILKMETPEASVQPDDFTFEYAIDGHVTSLSKEEFYDLRGEPDRNVELFTLLDDEDYVTEEPKNVEFAFRLRNCGQTCTFKMTHIYWA